MDSNLDELFSDLFAYRIMLQDSYDNESDIIREIKNYLIEIGISLANIPEIIHDFYKTYGFEISIEVINEVCINPVFNNIVSFTISSEDFNNNNQVIDVFSNSFSNHDQVQENSSDDEESEDINLSNNNNLQQMASNLLNINNNSLNQQMAQNIFQYVNFVNDNFNNHWTNNSVNHNSLVNVINSLVNNGSTYQNVVVSMDDKEVDKLESVKLESNLESNCSICMGQMEKEEMVTKLVCSHTFHTDCIQPYLKEYNYKCPICRTELGKVKYSL